MQYEQLGLQLKSLKKSPNYSLVSVHYAEMQNSNKQQT